MQVPIKILRDTGALDSFILESVLPFSSRTDGGCVITLGMGMVPFSVPLHLVPNCGLVQGEVSVGVRPQLPIEGLHMILGNDLAGDKVWADGQPNVVQPPTFPTVVEPSVTPLHLGDIFPACAVTRAASRDAQRMVEPECLELPDSLLGDQLAGSQAELVAEQKADSSLMELFVLGCASIRGEGYCPVLFPPKWVIGSEVAVTW